MADGAKIQSPGQTSTLGILTKRDPTDNELINGERVSRFLKIKKTNPKLQMKENLARTINGKSEACQGDQMEKEHLGEGSLCSGQSVSLEVGDQESNTSSVTSWYPAMNGCLPSRVCISSSVK